MSFTRLSLSLLGGLGSLGRGVSEGIPPSEGTDSCPNGLAAGLRAWSRESRVWAKASAVSGLVSGASPEEGEGDPCPGGGDSPD